MELEWSNAVAVTELDVANSALIKIGEKTLSDLNGVDMVTSAINAQLPLKRDQLLRMYQWNFATTRVVLSSADGSSPAFGFVRRFAVPADMLRLIGVYTSTDAVGGYHTTQAVHRVEGQFIYTDEISLNLHYIKQVTDPDEWDAAFRETFSWFLAAELSFYLSTGVEYTKTTHEMFERQLQYAQQADAFEAPLARAVVGATNNSSIAQSAVYKLGAGIFADSSTYDKAVALATGSLPLVRDRMLRKYRWNFATERVKLSSPDATAPVFGFTYRFAVPVDMLRLIGVYTEKDSLGTYTTPYEHYKVEGGFIYADVNPLYIFYTKQITDSAEWSSEFTELVIWKLAAEFAPIFVTSIGSLQQIQEMVDRAERTARAISLRESSQEVVSTSRWLDADDSHIISREMPGYGSL